MKKKLVAGRRLSKKNETEKTTEESTDSSEEAVSEEENSENVEQFGRRNLVTLVVGGFTTRPSRKLCRFQAARMIWLSEQTSTSPGCCKKHLKEGMPGLEDTDERNLWVCKNCRTFSTVQEAITFLESLKSE